MQSGFSFSKILKFVVPSIFMMIFMSLYTIVDGAFVSRFVNTDALASINIAYPYINTVLGISIMLGTGGCALVMKKLGEGKEEEAKQNFTLITLFSVVISIAIIILSFLFLEPLMQFLGVTPDLYEYCKSYLTFMIIFTTPTVLKFIMEQFLIAINKSNIALALTVTGGILNIVLDYVFIVVFDWGIKGAAIATGIGYAVPAFIGLIFFISKTNILHFKKPKFEWSVIGKSCYNGSSEMVSQVSSGIITFLYNMVMLKYIGESGVSAVTIILYVQFLVSAVFIGYSIGISPQISFFYGSKDSEALQKIRKASFKFAWISGVIIYIIIMLASPVLVTLFTEKGSEVYNITLEGLRIYSFGFLLFGFNIFTSGLFTALSNGKVSAIISFAKTLAFEAIAILLFPVLFGQDAVWFAVPFAQILGAFVCLYFYKKYKTVYNY